MSDPFDNFYWRTGRATMIAAKDARAGAEKAFKEKRATETRAQLEPICAQVKKAMASGYMCLSLSVGQLPGGELLEETVSHLRGLGYQVNYGLGDTTALIDWTKAE